MGKGVGKGVDGVKWLDSRGCETHSLGKELGDRLSGLTRDPEGVSGADLTPHTWRRGSVVR